MTPAELDAVEPGLATREDIEGLMAEVRLAWAQREAARAEVRRLQTQVHAFDTESQVLFARAQRAEAAALPPGHVAVPRELLDRVSAVVMLNCDADQPGNRSVVAELRALLGGGK